MKPLGGYTPVRNHTERQKPEEKEETPVSSDDVRNAVRLINDLDRSEYKISINTETNKITITRQEIFQ